MKQVYFATRNQGKIDSLGLVFSQYEVEIIQVPLDVPEPRSDSLDDIATQKVLSAYRHIQKPCIAVDAGCFVDSLDGFPGPYVNYALRTIGIEGILKLVEGKSREASLRSSLAYFDGAEETPLCFSSEIEGVLSPTPRGEWKDYFWSKLFHVFIPKGKTITLAEMSRGEYEEWRSQTSKDSFSAKFASWYAQK